MRIGNTVVEWGYISEEELKNIRKEINEELQRREDMQAVVREINEKLRKLGQLIRSTDTVDILNGQTGEVLLAQAQDITTLDGCPSLEIWVR